MENRNLIDKYETLMIKNPSQIRWVLEELLKENNKQKLTLQGVRFELPSDEIFKQNEVNLKNPLEEFYYYERPAYFKEDKKLFKERFKKALDFLKGN